MRSAEVVLALVVVCAACQYEARPVPAEQVTTGPVTSALDSVVVRQCTSEADCGPAQHCELTDTCFRTCHGDVCDSGCTGVCRGHGGSCQKTPMPQAGSCEGRWHIAWDEEGCPRPPVCLCPDGSPQAPGGGCASTCSPPVCAEGQALVAGDACYQGCATACVGDDDCQGGEHCVRQGSCALVVCGPANHDPKSCRDGRECYGICVR